MIFRLAATDDLSDRSITPFPLPTDESGDTVTYINTGENDSNNEDYSKKVISNRTQVGGKKHLSNEKNNDYLNQALVKTIGCISKLLEEQGSDTKKSKGEENEDEDLSFSRSLVWKWHV